MSPDVKAISLSSIGAGQGGAKLLILSPMAEWRFRAFPRLFKGSAAVVVSLLLSRLLLSIPSVLAAQSVTQWVARYSHTIGSDEQASKVVADANGDLIIAGYTADGSGNQDMLIVKYSSLGLAVWTNRYDGFFSNDVATALAVDGTGNVLVTGNANFRGNSSYVTIKYSGAGIPLWTNYYEGPGFGRPEYMMDIPQAMGVDSSGNIYVTGYSWNGGQSGNYDYATVAYSSSGTQRWVNRYDGPGGRHDHAQALAVDSEGNVLVTGTSTGAAGDVGYATIKYSSAGLPLWTNRYGGYHAASAVAVHTNGDVFVTGWFQSVTNLFDFLTIKYSSAGLLLWTNQYSGPAGKDDQPLAMAVDASGSVVVTGSSVGIGTSNDFVTIKYSNLGVPLWTNRYDGPKNADDGAQAVAVDASGKVYVTGHSHGGGTHADYATVAYSSLGLGLWTNRYNGPANTNDWARAIAVTSTGHVYVTGYAQENEYASDIATIAYSDTGAALWTNCYCGQRNGDDRAEALAVDDEGNVYVTGYSWSGGLSYDDDYLTIAYSSLGIPLWTNRYDGAIHSEDRATAVAVGGNGNVYVTGLSAGAADSADYLTIAYSKLGIPLWTNRYDAPGRVFDRRDYAHAVAAGQDGNVYVTGLSSRNAYPYASVDTVAYSSMGVPLWTNCFPSRGGLHSGIAVALDGTVYVAGTSYASAAEDYALFAYTASGATLWTGYYDGNGYDVAEAIALDRDGNAYVTGRSESAGGWTDYATVAYSKSGGPVWTNRSSHLAYANDKATAIAADNHGNVYVTGTAKGGDGLYDYDYATIAYSSSGVELWSNRYGPTNSEERATAVAVDGRGLVYVTGHSYVIDNGTDSGADYLTLAYSNTGLLLWTNRYNGPANGEDLPGGKSCLAVGPDGAVYVTGSSESGPVRQRAFDYATVKYVVSPWITAGPLSLTNQAGSIATFTVTVAGTGPFGFQWRFKGLPLASGGNISGANTPSLSISNVRQTDAGDYTVVITNLVGLITSEVATLSVVAPMAQLSSVERLPDGNIKLSLSGPSTLNFRLDSSTNLIHWVKLADLTNPPGVFHFIDFSATNVPYRFYRGVWLP